jgi:hypothetical protein
MIEVTFEFADGKEAGTAHLDHVPRVGDTVLWPTYVVKDGEELEHDQEYPVTAVRWVLTPDEHRDPGSESIARVFFGSASTPGSNT